MSVGVLTALELDVNLTWAFARSNGLFKATKQGRDNRAWSLAGLNLLDYNQAIIFEETFNPGQSLIIDLTSDNNLLLDNIALQSVLTIMVKVLPTTIGLNNGLAIIAPGVPNGFPWLWLDTGTPSAGGATGDVAEIIHCNGLYLASYGVGESGTNLNGKPVSPTQKTLMFENTGSDPIDIFAFIGGLS